jgi:hypothetical protein
MQWLVLEKGLNDIVKKLLLGDNNDLIDRGKQAQGPQAEAVLLGLAGHSVIFRYKNQNLHGGRILRAFR